jgi:hypothetical protein
MTGSSIAILKATLVCGILDIIYALAMAAMKGGSAKGVLKFVAEGPFGSAVPSSPWAASALGLAVHFIIMAAMATFCAVAMRSPRLADISPWLSGTVYGILLYGLMYWIVMPLRWPSIFPQVGLINIVEALFAHIVLVGIPMALIIGKTLRDQPQTA